MSIEATSLLRRVQEPGDAQRGRARGAGLAAVSAAGAAGVVLGGAASSRSAGGLEDIAHASHGVDHRLAAGVDLLAQVGDVELDDVGLTAEVVVPHPVE